MPTPDQARVQELYLANGNTALTDYVDLTDFQSDFWQRGAIYLSETFPVHGQATINGISFHRQASGKSSTTGTSGEVMVITIPLLIAGAGSGAGGVLPAGDIVIANEQAILTKLREAKRGAGAFALANSVFLWMRLVGSSSYVYWPVVAGGWQPLLPKVPAAVPLRAGVLTLTCLPFAQGDPIFDPISPVLTPYAPTLYRAAIPGDVEALTKVRLYDNSTGGKVAQRLTLYSRSIDGMVPGDWTPNYPVTHVAPGAAINAADGYNLVAARIIAGPTWQTIGGVQGGGGGAYQTMTDADVIVKLRDSAAPIVAPTNVGVSGAKGTGGLGGGTYTYIPVGKNAGGARSALGPPASITIQQYPTVTLTLSGWQWGGSYTLAFNGQVTPPIGPGQGATDVAAVLQNLSTIGFGNVVVSGIDATHSKQTIATGSGSAGSTTMTFSFEGQTTPVLPYEAPPAQVQAALQALSSIGQNNVFVTSAGAATAYNLEFANDLAGVVIQPLSVVFNDAATATVTITQNGAVAGPFTISFPNPELMTAPPGTLLQVASSFKTPGDGAYILAATPSNLWTNTPTWTNNRNTTAVDLYWQRNGGQWRVVALGNVATYNHIGETAGVAAVIPTTLGGQVQPSEVRVGYGLSAAFIVDYTDGTAANISNGEWEYVNAGTIPLPPAEVPEGAVAPSWYLTIQGINSGGTSPTLDVDSIILIPHDGDSVTVTSKATLSAPAIWDIDTRRDGRVSASILAQNPLTASGNEITDAQAVPGGLRLDRVGAPRGYGIWGATTNIIENSDAVNDLLGATGASQCILSAGVGPFTGSGFRTTSTVLNGTTTISFVKRSGTFLAAVAGQPYTATCTFNANTSILITFQIQFFNVSNAFLGNAVTTMAAVAGTWQTISATGTAPAGTTQASIVFQSSAGAVGSTVDMAGLQLEPSAWPTPLLKTTVNSASRGAARVQGPGGVMSPGVGWVAARVELGLATSGTGLVLGLFDWRQGGTAILQVRYNVALSRWEVISINGGTDEVVVSAGPYATGAATTVVASWTTTALGLSVNGSALATAARTSGVQAALGSLFDIGSLGGANQFNGRVRWFACGQGTLTNADAAALNALEATPPGPGVLGSGEFETLVWPALQAYAWSPSPSLLGSATFSGQLLLGPGAAIVGAYAEYLDTNGNYVADVQHQSLLIQPTLRPRFAFARGAV